MKTWIILIIIIILTFILMYRPVRAHYKEQPSPSPSVILSPSPPEPPEVSPSPLSSPEEATPSASQEPSHGFSNDGGDGRGCAVNDCNVNKGYVNQSGMPLQPPSQAPK